MSSHCQETRLPKRVSVPVPWKTHAKHDIPRPWVSVGGSEEENAEYQGTSGFEGPVASRLSPKELELKVGTV